MPTFTYKALRKEDNTSYENTVEAKDRFEIYNIVRKEGGQVISVTESKKINVLTGDIGHYFAHVGEADKIRLTRNLSAMLIAGLSLIRALNVIERQSKNSKLKLVLKEMQQNIQQGSDLNSAMARHPKVFDSLMTAMVKAGEESGSLSESLRIISDQTERSYELKKKIRGAMIYPSVILTVLLGIGVLMMMFIVPTIAGTFEDLGVELPMSTQIILKISYLLTHYTIPMLLGGTLFVTLLVMVSKTAQGKRFFETIFLHIPVIGELVKETNSARTGRTLSSLLSSGVNVVQGLEITEEVLQNTYYKEVVNAVKKRVQKGSPMAEVFIENEKLYPPLVGELVAVGEETGNLPTMLQEIAGYYEKEVDQKTKNMSTIIEPLLMLVVGGAVGYFAVAMLQPIYSVVENF
jgi:type IV pilus assembly protein PilC